MKQQEVLVKEYFEKHAEDWQSIYSAKDPSSLNIQLRQSYVLDYVDNLSLKEGARILDLGCGAGLTSAELLRRGFIVVGVDVSENMLKLARNNCDEIGVNHNCTFQLGDAEALELESNSFDAVIAMGVIEYLRWYRWAVQEMHRILKPGGYLILTVPNRIRLSYLTDPKRIFSLVRQKVRGMQSNSETFDRNLFVPSALNRMVTKLDFKVLDSVSHGFDSFSVLNRSSRLSSKLNRTLQKASDKRVLPFLSHLGSNYIVLCQKRTQPSEIGKRLIFRNMGKRIKMFESENREFFSQTTTWLNRNREYMHMNVQELNTRGLSGKNVLVISPHPDDEIIGCGGTLIKMVEEGVVVSVIYLTDGSNCEALRDCPENVRKAKRIEEAKDVADTLGLSQLILWRESDSHLKCTRDNVRMLTEILNRLQPQIIFVPFVNDRHNDHVIANLILQEALEILKVSKGDILSYEVWSSVPVNTYCVIDDQFDEKAELLMKYRTGMKVVDYVHFCESLNSYHSCTCLGKKGFAEVFFALDANEYLSLVQRSCKS